MKKILCFFFNLLFHEQSSSAIITDNTLYYFFCDNYSIINTINRNYQISNQFYYSITTTKITKIDCHLILARLHHY